jgi:hypothetical protein
VIFFSLGRFVNDLTMLSVAEVDEAVAEAKKDGTGGRGANGSISSALAEEHKKDEVIKSAV